MSRPRLTLFSAATLAVLVGSGACNDTTAPGRLTTLNVSLGAVTLEIGQVTAATAAGFDQDGATIAIGPVLWTSDDAIVAAVSPSTGLIMAISPGITRILATVDGVVGERTVSVTRSPEIRINEIQSRGDGPGGWIEFFNPTTGPVDMSGWTLVDENFFGPTFMFPVGSTIPAGGYLVIEEDALPFGIDAADSALLFSRYGVLVNSTFWRSQPLTTYGRCPDATGTFVATAAPTKGTVNACAAN